MSNTTQIKRVIEACLLTANDIVDLKQLHSIFDNQLSDTVLINILTEIAQDYAERGVELIKIASGYRFRSRLEFQSYINKLNKEIDDLNEDK